MKLDEVLLEVADVRVLTLTQQATHRLQLAVGNEVVLQVAALLEGLVAPVDSTGVFQAKAAAPVVELSAHGEPLWWEILKCCGGEGYHRQLRFLRFARLRRVECLLSDNRLFVLGAIFFVLVITK